MRKPIVFTRFGRVLARVLVAFLKEKRSLPFVNQQEPEQAPGENYETLNGFMHFARQVGFLCHQKPPVARLSTFFFHARVALASVKIFQS